MHSPIFVFLGVTETDSSTDIIALQTQLASDFLENSFPIRIDRNDQLLILRLTNPNFCFYVSFANNDHKTLQEWKDLARNFELPWDIKPVDKNRLEKIYSQLEKKGWTEYKAHQQVGLSILEKLQAFEKVKVFTIPSMGETSIWRRILGEP